VSELAKINELYFDRPNSRKIDGPFVQQPGEQQHYVRGDDLERMTSARQEAEALFAPKKQITERPLSAAASPSEPSPRKPRILRALSPASSRLDHAEAPARAEERLTTEVPTSQWARIRAWVEYGMPAAQVAAVCGVAVEVIERILRHT